jgi:hypothetical protein
MVKKRMTADMIAGQVALMDYRFINDKPLIRQNLNDTMDSMERDGQITRKQSDMLSQDRLVKLVQKKMRERKLGKVI